MSTYKSIDRDIQNAKDELRKAQEKLAKLEQDKKKFEGLSDEQRLAELIHDSQCRWNHTDGCGWYYESWDVPGYSKEEYLRKAKNILKEVPFDQAIKLVKMM